MTGREREAWIRFHLAPLREDVKKRLLNDHESPREILELSGRDLERAGILVASRWRKFLNCEIDPDEVACKLDRVQAWCVTYHDDAYPAPLREIVDPPALLFGLGDKTLLKQRTVAIVGSRKSDHHAADWTAKVAGSAAANGFTVASGMALGIDGAAHRGALAVGGGTVAVLGTGVDLPSPRFHARLYQEIVDRGAVISEYPPGEPGHKSHFPKRNRIIAGLSEAVLIAQAAEKSGAAITARLALDSGRDVFVMAANPWDARFAGNKRFAREGAPVIYDGDDLVLLLGGTPLPICESGISLDGLPGDEQTVASALGEAPSRVDEISRSLGMSTAEVAGLLLRLELRGVAVEGPGKVYELARPGIVR